MLLPLEKRGEIEEWRTPQGWIMIIEAKMDLKGTSFKDETIGGGIHWPAGY